MRLRCGCIVPLLPVFLVSCTCTSPPPRRCVDRTGPTLVAAMRPLLLSFSPRRAPPSPSRLSCLSLVSLFFRFQSNSPRVVAFLLLLEHIRRSCPLQSFGRLPISLPFPLPAPPAVVGSLSTAHTQQTNQQTHPPNQCTPFVQSLAH